MGLNCLGLHGLGLNCLGLNCVGLNCLGLNCLGLNCLFHSYCLGLHKSGVAELGPHELVKLFSISMIYFVQGSQLFKGHNCLRVTIV